MFEIFRKERLAEGVCRMEVHAPLAARHARAGQFVILRVEEGGERIPLTISAADRARGTISLVFQTVGATTSSLARKACGDKLKGVVGPLGVPTDIRGVHRAIVAGGGVGCAIALPVARELHEAGAEVVSVIGFREKSLVILEEDFAACSDRVIVTTDDGSYGECGNVTAPLSRLLREDFDAVYVIGPLPMMKAVAEATRPYGVKTIASMNPIMIDGTGMCGCCRVRVGGEVKFACVDGPDFDAHLVDFDEIMQRNRTYSDFEAREREKDCRLLRGGNL